MVVGAGILLGGAGFWLAENWPAVGAKLRGDAPDCPWGEVLGSLRFSEEFARLLSEATAGISLGQRDDPRDIELLNSRERAFWIKRGENQTWNGKYLLAYLLAEHTLLGKTNPGEMVRPGDIVLDCGAHVGVFTHFALKRGASKVVAVEPDTGNQECFRRNFAPELAAGRVALVEKAVWDTPGTLVFRESNLNSGSGSVDSQPGDRDVKVQATTVDILVDELNLPQVNFIKMDIEGAEREALRGAQMTLKKYRPRLMLDTYHRPDDPVVLTRRIQEAYPAYRSTCGPCEVKDNRLVPHAIFFHP